MTFFHVFFLEVFLVFFYVDVFLLSLCCMLCRHARAVQAVRIYNLFELEHAGSMYDTFTYIYLRCSTL